MENIKCRPRLRLITGCSGTDGPVKAMEKLIPKYAFEHVISADTDTASQQLIWEDEFDHDKAWPSNVKA